jgi:hypothetical protein
VSGIVEQRHSSASVAGTLRSPPLLAAFGVALAGMLAAALLQRARPFYWDSGDYWYLMGTFTHKGHFSLLNFTNPQRGYGQSLIFYGLKSFGDALKLGAALQVKLFNTVVFTLIETVVAPAFAQLAWPSRRWGPARRVLLAGVLIAFWNGYLNFPLTDFPALGLALIAIMALSRPDAPGWMLLAGFAAGLATDLRPAYLAMGPIVAGLLLLAWFAQRGKPHASATHRLLCAGLLVLGFAAVSLPQSLATHRHYSTWSFIPGAAIDMSDFQVSEGLRLMRYETYVGAGHGPDMRYEDPAGLKLLSKQPYGIITSTSQYLKLVATHPITMAGIYARHVINGLDQRYSTQYIEHLAGGSQRWSRIAGFLIAFLALVRVLWPAARRSLSPARWRYPLALLCCYLPVITTDGESRYLLPVHMLAYLLVLAPGWPNPIGPRELGLRRFRTAAIVVAAYVVFMAIVLHVTGEATRHLQIV